MQWKQQIVLCVSVVFAAGVYAADEVPLAIAISAPQEYAKSKLLVCVVGTGDPALQDVAQQLKRDLEFSGQFDVAIKLVTAFDTKQSMTAVFHENDGYLLALFLNSADNSTAIEWRMYDGNGVMHKGKKYHKHGTVGAVWADNIADSVWPELTGQAGCFSTRIAYCKQVRGKKGQLYKHIYHARIDGSDAHPLITTPTVNIAPCWNKDTYNPLLFYSESTNTNVRLMVTTLHGTRKVASNIDGLTMLPAFSRDGKKIVYCASQGTGSCQLYEYEKGKTKRLTHAAGNALSPSLSDDGRILYFCSDKTGTPHIYRCDLLTNEEVQITSGTPAYSPNYCTKRSAIVYTKMVKGVAQICVYDEITKQHTQLTADVGNKEECSWSACGNYIIFGFEDKKTARIALLNLMTNERRFITDAKDRCSYPSWSPSYYQLS